MLDAPTRAAQAKALKAIEAKARSFVPRYRTLEEGEANGVYTIRLEAEVDEIALRRKIERGASPSTPPPVTPAKMGVPGRWSPRPTRARPALPSSAAWSRRCRRPASARGPATPARRAPAPPPRPRRAPRWSRRRW